MDEKQIIDRCKALEARLVDKGFIMPEANIRVPGWFDNGATGLIEARATKDYSSRTASSWHGDTVEDVLAKMSAWVDSLKSPAQQERDRFIQDLGRLIDKGRELGIDEMAEAEAGSDAPLAMIEAAMKRLSENILTDQRAA